MWSKGAIISSSGSGYRAVDDVFNAVELGTEYISDHIIENPENEVFFERVYKVDLITKVVYKLKSEAKELLSKEFAE